MTPLEKIGHYTIVGKLGEGGMGAVYRALDTRLNREVAIKVLPPGFAEDRMRVERFQREAHVLAALNHPNIAAIYGIEDGAIVMELVEGGPLRGPLPVETALDYARQIAAGLEAAHEKGIVHRDLKPSNIHVTADGVVKLLDFGLARTGATAASSAAGNQTNSPTLSLDSTQAGTLLGTAAYMSPEQARGKAVDKRADIWAFGVVLYEMVTGKPLFAGETVAEVLAQVIATEPNISGAPAGLQPALRRCLERDPKKRLRDIGDVWIPLEAARATAAPAASTRPSRVPWFLAAMCALLAVLFAVFWLRTPGKPGTTVRFTLDLPGVPNLSPDGRLLLDARDYSSHLKAGNMKVRGIGDADWRDLTLTAGAKLPFWSEDSSAIGFFAEGRLKIIAIDGKSPVRDVAPAPEPMGGTWRGGMADGKIIFASPKQLYVADLASGAVRDLGVPLPPGSRAELPGFLPEGDGFVFVGAQSSRDTLFRARLGSPTAAPERLFDSVYNFVFGRNPHTGAWHIFFASGPSARTLFTSPINPKTGTATGPTVKLLDGIAHSSSFDMQFDAARNGTVTWRKARIALPIWRLRWFDRSGAVLGTVSDPGSLVSFALSPDEKRAAVEQGIGEEEIWMYDLQRGAGSRFSTLPKVFGTPLWSPDGAYVYYTVQAPGPLGVVVRQPAAGSDAEIVMRPPQGLRVLWLEDISADGKSLILGATDSSGTKNLLLRGDLATGKMENLLPRFDAAHIGRWARLTPDDRWLLFAAADTPSGLYAVPYPPQATEPRLVSTAVSQWPFLSKDGRWLYGFKPDYPAGITMQPIITSGGTFRLGDRLLAFPLESSTRSGGNIGAVSRDGSRILAIAGDQTDELKTQVLTDWTVLLGSAQK